MKFEEDIKKLGFGDLYALYQFISGDADRTFGTRTEAKKLIFDRHKIVLAELNSRAYGQNPYELDKVDVKGDPPEKVLNDLRKAGK